MRQVFISDLHLDAGLDYLRAGFIKFLDEVATQADELYILGDFFEVWLGDDHDTSFNREIIGALNKLDCAVFLMHGNRDFLLGEHFCAAAGATLLDDPAVIETPAGPALLLHGDSLCTKDTVYMDARAFLRSSEFQEELLQKSIDERAALARQLRGESKAHTRETAADIMDVTPEEVVTALKEADVQMMIHGHTHRPAIHELIVKDKPAVRYVLGDWNETMQYLLIENEQPELLSYAVGTPE